MIRKVCLIGSGGLVNPPYKKARLKSKNSYFLLPTSSLLTPSYFLFFDLVKLDDQFYPADGDAQSL